MEHGYEVESLDSHAIENVVAWARLFRDPPDPPLMLEGFVYYCRYDAFPQAPGAGPPPPWEEVQRRLDREFYDGLGAEAKTEWITRRLTGEALARLAGE